MSQPAGAIPPPWGPEDSLRRVEDAVVAQGGRTKQLSDGSVLGTCPDPTHDDRSPSLHVTWQATEHGGRCLLYCPACGDRPQDEWASLLGLEYDDLFDDRRWSLHHRTQEQPRRRATRGTGVRTSKMGPLPSRIVPQLDKLLEQEPAPAADAVPECEHDYQPQTTYPYRDAAGSLVQEVVRLRCTSCGGKTFRQRYRAGNGRWVNREPEGFTTVLYRHPEVVAAVAEDQDVWVLEGEKDVDTAVGLGLCATTNARGGANFPAALGPVFTGAHVTVVLDRDDTGWARGVQLYETLSAAGAQTVRILLPGLNEAKADFTDHVEAGQGLEDLLEVPVEAVRAWAGLKDVRRQVARVEEIHAEATAQMQVAEHDARAGRRAKAVDRRRYATRWARESARVFDQLLAAQAQVAQHAGEVSGDRWAEQAAEQAVAQLHAAAAIARDTYGLVDEAVPATMSVEQLRCLPAAVGAHVSAAPVEAPGDESQEAPRTGLRLVQGDGSEDIRGGGGGGGRFVPDVRIEHDEYVAINGEIVQLRHSTNREGETTTRHQRVINRIVRIVAKEIAESDDDLEQQRQELASLGGRDDRGSRQQITNLKPVTHQVFSWVGRDGTEQQVRVSQDDAESGAWLSHLAEPGLDFKRTRSGRESVMSAINYISTDFEVVTSYRSTGWRQADDGSWMYLSADGAITAGGYCPISTNVTGPASRFVWPDPTDDPARLRAAFLGDSAGLMDRIPERVAVGLLGTAYRAVLCPNEWVTVLSASPGVGKTGLAALTMHHFGELWDRHRPMSSMSGQGSTMNALRLQAHQAKDALMFLDDVAPTAGTDQAWKRLEETIRLISNQESRARAERDGQGVLPGTRPRSSALITTELPPRAGTSGERRALILPLSRGEVDIEDIRALDQMESRHGRALLMAGFLRWLAAQGMPDALSRAAGLRDELRRQLAAAAHPHRAWIRHGDKIGELWAGWGLMLDYLTEAGALSQDEGAAWRQRVQAALLVTAESCEDPDLVGSTAERVTELLRYALASGEAYACDIRTGEAPVGLERRLGWKPRRGGRDSSPALGQSLEPIEWQSDPRAIELGYVSVDPQHTGDTGRELIVSRSALEATLKAAASAMTDTTAIDLGTVLRALDDDDLIKTQVERRAGGSVVRRTLTRTIWCLSDGDRPVRDKRVVLRLDAILGDTQDESGPGQGPDDEPPTGPERPGGGTGGVPGRPPESPVLPDADPVDGPAEVEVPPALEQPHDEQQEGAVASHSTAGGLSLPAQQEDQVGACLVCGQQCAVSFAGRRMHLPCFWAHSAATVEQLPSAGAPAEQQESAAAAPAETPVPAGDEPERGRRDTQRRAAAAGRAVEPDRRFRAAVVVADVEHAWLPDGTQVPYPGPIRHLGDLEALGRSLGLGHAPMAWRTTPEAGLVVPTHALWEQLGVPTADVPERPSKRKAWFEEISEGLPALAEATEAGWVFGRGDRDPLLRGLTRLRRADAERGSVAVLFTPGMPTDWGLDGDPLQVARRLQMFTDAIGIPFRASPISTGLDLMRIVLSRQARDALARSTPADFDEVGPAAAADLEEQFDWTRAPSPAEGQAQWLALYDRGGSYLAGWSSLRLGIGKPQLLEGDAAVFDRRRAGWWLVQLPDGGDELAGEPFPDLLDPQGNRAGQQVWVTTPTLEYAVHDLDLDVPVLKAWAWPADESKAYLTPMYKVLRQALQQLRDLDDPDAAAAAVLVKQVYKQLAGFFVSVEAKPKNGPGSDLSFFQPYWYHAMRGQARRAILHQIRKTGQDTGRWPLVASNNDLIGYAVDEPDMVKAWPGDPTKIGFGLGDFKPARWAHLEEHRRHLTGHGWSGLETTTTVDEAMPTPAAGDEQS